MDLTNLLIGLSILLPSLLLLTCGLRVFGRKMHFRLQLFSLVFFAVAIIGSFYFIFGKETALYLVSGFSLGMGIALRPLFSRILSGMIFDATHIYDSKQITIEKDKITGKIIQIGLLHTWMMDKNSNLYMIGNKYLEDTPVKIELSEKDRQTFTPKNLDALQYKEEVSRTIPLKFV